MVPSVSVSNHPMMQTYSVKLKSTAFINIWEVFKLLGALHAVSMTIYLINLDIFACRSSSRISLLWQKKPTGMFGASWSR